MATALRYPICLICGVSQWLQPDTRALLCAGGDHKMPLPPQRACTFTNTARGWGRWGVVKERGRTADDDA